MYREIINALKISQDYIKSYVKEGQTVLDSTVGNGNDTLLLARAVGPNGKVYGFDKQIQAIKNTRERLACEKLNHRVQLIEDGHENIDSYIKEELDFIIYNLGYLPKGDKQIKTKKETTIVSLEKALKLLRENGIILITSYTGHEGGLEEKDGIERLLGSLDQKEYNVIKYDFINQKNSPPVVFGVEKSKSRR